MDEETKRNVESFNSLLGVGKRIVKEALHYLTNPNEVLSRDTVSENQQRSNIRGKLDLYKRVIDNVARGLIDLQSMLPEFPDPSCVNYNSYNEFHIGRNSFISQNASFSRHFSSKEGVQT
jgi:hypothetical protein